MKWHRHGPWTNREEFFTPPRRIYQVEMEGGEESLLSYLYGITTITEECSTCHYTRAFTVPGRTAGSATQGEK